MHSRIHDDSRWAEDLLTAVDRGELRAVFQPQIDLATRQIVAVEALCRWHHPQFGMVSPREFIPLAESTGVIHAIGQFMVDESCRTAADWHHLGFPLQISVNVSAAQLATANFSDRLVTALTTLALPPESLTLEITESLPIMDLATVRIRLGELRNLGMGVSIDDYGTGHSSLDQLTNLPATEVKIDQSLVQDDSAEACLLINDVVRIAHAGGVRVVAEGVETSAHLDRVRQLRCDRAQGYLLGRPMERVELEALIA